jgi:circadian clock protein KaiC
VLKSRGMKHSNQIREFLITSSGIRLEPVYVGPEGVLTGSMRAAQEARENAARLERGQQAERRQRELAARRAALEAQIKALQAEFAAAEQEASVTAAQAEAREDEMNQQSAAAALRRGGALPGAKGEKTTTRGK